MIYADNAATTKISKTALNAMLPFLEENYGNPSSLYEFGQKSKEALENARKSFAENLGCTSREIIFTSGGSEADNQAIITAAEIGEKAGKKHIISTAFEHHAVINTLKMLENKGFSITLLDVHKGGVITAEEVENAIREDTCLVTVMYANNEIGTIQPIAEIGKVCRKKGVLFHTDAVQAAGHLHIDVVAENIDMLSLSAHKFHGPKGVGVLYVKKGILIKGLINGGAQEFGKRAGTENVSGIVAAAVAFEEMCAGIDENSEKLTALRNRLIKGLEKIPYSELNGDKTKRLPGNVSFCFEGVEGESLLLLLDDKGICASSGSACTSGSLDPSHVLLAIGRPHEVAHGSLRLTIGEDTTEEDIEYIIDSVKEVVEKLRNMSPFWHDLQVGKRPHIF